LTPKPLKGAALRSYIRERPAWFCREVLGVTIWDKQEELISKAFKFSRLAVAGCVSSSKTHAGALLTFCWLFGWGPGSRVFTLAPSYRQVDLNLWGEIPRIHKNAPKPLGGKMLLTTQYNLDKDWYALGFSTKEPEMVHGIHGPKDLLIIDDAHAVPEPLYDEVENMMAGGDTHIVLLYNSMRLSGTTYHARHRDRKLWNPMTISYLDTPNAKAGKVVVPGMLKPDIVEMWGKKYGNDSDFYRVKVLAKDPRQESNTLIPLEWLELALVRETPEPGDDAVRAYGQDVARFGDDDSVRCELLSRRVQGLKVRHGNDTMETALEIVGEQRERPGLCAVDVIGVGSGTYDRCVEEGSEVMAVNVSEASTEVDEVGKQKFFNLRSQLWWEARESFDPKSDEADLFSLAYMDREMAEELIAELSCVRFRHTAKGIQVEPKEGESEKWGLKKRLGHSCDKADAYVLARHAMRHSVPGGIGDLVAVVQDES